MKITNFLTKINLLLIATIALTISLINCGGGGGGGSGEEDFANAIIEASPGTIEVGGSQTVSIRLNDVSENLAIKIRFPVALQYITGSAVFSTDDGSAATNPAFNLSENQESGGGSSSSTASSASSASATPTATPTSATTSSSAGSEDVEKQYLVFFITKDAFGADRDGDLVLNLRGKDILDSGRIELDVDLDDPSINNSAEFSVSNPLFEKEQAVDIRVSN